MKLEMTSKLEPRLPHANHGAVHLFIGLLPTLAAIHPLHDDLSSEGFATPNTPSIYGKPVDIYTVSHVVVYIYLPPLFPLAFSDYNPN
jgi:hypothetical protein